MRTAYRPRELAESLGISERTVRRAIQAGNLHVQRVGRCVLIPREQAEAWRTGVNDEIRKEARRLLGMA